MWEGGVANNVAENVPQQAVSRSTENKSCPTVLIREIAFNLPFVLALWSIGCHGK